VAKQKAQDCARIDPHALTVPLLRATTPVVIVAAALSVVIVLTLRPSLLVVPGVALVVASREADVIALGVVPSNVSRLIIAIQSAPLRRHR